MSENLKLTPEECEFIRSLSDFDLTMLLSEVHDHGWPQARKLIPLMRQALATEASRRDDGGNGNG